MIITKDGDRHFPHDNYVPVKILRDGRMTEDELRGTQYNLYKDRMYVPVVFFPKRKTTPHAKAN